MISPRLKRILDCKARELVRFTDQHGTQWALVGDRGNERLMLLVLPLDSTPYCENIMGPMDILRAPFEGTLVLSYGMNYSISLDHAGDCEIGGIGELIKAHGAYVMTAKDDSICCRDARYQNKTATAYYDLTTGAVRGQPGSEHAVFARWELALTDEPPTRLLLVRANKPSVIGFTE